jgi:hypothetical protein
MKAKGAQAEVMAFPNAIQTRGWLENFAKRNVSCGLNSRYGVVMEPRHCERSEAIQFVPQKDSGLLRRFRSSQ